MLQMIKSDRRMFSASDDSTMMKQIQATHAPDGRELDVKPFLHIIEDILRRANPIIDGGFHGTQEHVDHVEDSASLAGFDDILEALAYIIHKISCEISCKCSSGGDAHATTMVLFNTLTSYSWDAKVVLSLAAFAVNYGEFWLVAKLSTTNPLAKSVAFLKQLPDIIEHSNSLKPQYDALKKLIIGQEMTCHADQNFPELRVLKLWVLPKLELWTVENGAMPQLRELEISDCKKLRSSEGLDQLPALKELILTDMPQDFVEDARKKLGNNYMHVIHSINAHGVWDKVRPSEE